jgi:hypothetical protein
MGLHPQLPRSPYDIPRPEHRWFPADAALRQTAYEKLLPPLVARIREQASEWRDAGCSDTSETSCAMLQCRFATPHLIEAADSTVMRDVLTKPWSDRIDYWAVDFDYTSRRVIIRVPRAAGVDAVLPAFEAPQGEPAMDFEERWTGGYIFENEWQSFRTRQDRRLDLISAPHTYDRPGRYTVAVKVVDIFGNDTMTLVPVSVG